MPPHATASAAARRGPGPRGRGLLRRHGGEVARFGSVGAVAYVVDVGLFNLLRFGPGELLADKPLTAKMVAAAVATLVAWLGSRYWTFAARRTATPLRELVFFVAVNGVAMLAAVACLAVSHYVLGLTSPLADNISANVVGVVLGTVLRFVLYRTVVFTGTATSPESQAAALTGAAPAVRRPVHAPRRGDGDRPGPAGAPSPTG